MSQGRERNDRGQYVGTITLADVLGALGALTSGDTPVATAKPVGEYVECSGEAARQKLVELHEQGRAGRQQVGAGAVVWWSVADGVEDAREVNPEDPMFDRTTYRSGGTVTSENVDDLLYGDPHR